MKEKPISDKIVEFLKERGGRVTIHEFWNFYYKLGSNRLREFQRLRKKGIVDYEVVDGWVKYVILKLGR